MNSPEQKLARARELYIELATKPERTAVAHCEEMLEKRKNAHWKCRLADADSQLIKAEARCGEIFDHFIEEEKPRDASLSNNT